MNRASHQPAALVPGSSARIVLATLNAKYIHASLGLRCLLANMDRHGGAGLRAQTQLREFVIGQPVTLMVEELLALAPEVIGLGVYIWNVVETTQLVRLLKALRPDIRIVLGGPEVSFEIEQQEICRLADHVVTGWGDVSFPKLCRALLDGPKPLMKVIAGEQPPLDELALPYAEYTAEDLAQRLLYVEASRGCPFKCEFCLSFNPEVQQRISRKQDNGKTADNLRWLVSESRAHVHADLIFGLPGETLESFAEGFDRLFGLRPHEIQFGVLKRLRGTPITRHTDGFAMVYDPQTPYTILQNSTVDFAGMQRIKRFARYWEMVANSGRFAQGLALLLAPGSAFGHFLAFSDWLWQSTGKTHEFALEKLVDLLFVHLTQARALDPQLVAAALLADYQASGARGRPHCLAALLAGAQQTPSAAGGKVRAERQGRHLGQQQALREEIQKAAAAA